MRLSECVTCGARSSISLLHDYATISQPRADSSSSSSVPKPHSFARCEFKIIIQGRPARTNGNTRVTPAQLLRISRGGSRRERFLFQFRADLSEQKRREEKIPQSEANKLIPLNGRRSRRPKLADRRLTTQNVRLSLRYRRRRLRHKHAGRLTKFSWPNDGITAT